MLHVAEACQGKDFCTSVVCLSGTRSSLLSGVRKTDQSLGSVVGVGGLWSGREDRSQTQRNVGGELVG